MQDVDGSTNDWQKCIQLFGDHRRGWYKESAGAGGSEFNVCFMDGPDYRVYTRTQFYRSFLLRGINKKTRAMFDEIPEYQTWLKQSR